MCRLLPSLSFVVTFALIGCDADRIQPAGRGGSDAAPRADATPFDSGTADGGLAPDRGYVSDVGVAADASATDTGVEPFVCDPLQVPTSSLAYSSITGRVEIFDFYHYDEGDDAPKLWRNFGFPFLEQALPPRGSRDAVLFRGIPSETCMMIDIPNDQRDLGAWQNVGTELVVEVDGAVIIRIPRIVDMGRQTYRPGSGPTVLPFGLPSISPLSRDWIWSTPGDSAAGIRPARAVMPPLEDFAVTPAFTSTTTPMAIDPAAARIRWTPPTGAGATMSIVLSKALGTNGDGRYVFCRPDDDGDFTIPAAAIAALAPSPDVPFSFSVARASAAPFCNEGVPSGVVTHTLVHDGSAVVR